MSILGNRVVRVEDPRFLTVGGTYVADLRDPLLDGAGFVVYARSTLAHGLLTAVHVEDAVDAPGVLAVFTGADVDLAPQPPAVPMLNGDMVRPWLAVDRVRFVGEPIAAVVAERPELAVDAADLVWAEYEPLPAVIDLDEAATDAVLLFPEAGTNTSLELEFGHDDDLLAGCEVVVSHRFLNQRLAACPLEVRGAAAAWDGEDRIHLFVSTQNAHGVRDALARYYDLEPGEIRVVAPDVGGGFGPKIGANPEELLLPWMARRLGRPVRWHETRTENMVGLGHGRGQLQDVEIGGRRDGTIEAYRLTILQDTGAYPSGFGGFLPYLTRMMTSGVYAISKVETASRSVVTNTTPTHAYRGAGRPEATAAIERAVDLFAAEIGADPSEVRRRNLVPADAFPHTTPVGTTYDCGDYAGALDRALEAVGYAELRAEQLRRREAGDPLALGIGIACYVEVTAGPGPGQEFARVEVAADGRVTVFTGSSPHGQGHETAFAMLAADELGVPMEAITVVYGDTDLVARGEGTMGSRSLQLGGAAVHQAAIELVDIARALAADLLEAHVDDVVLDRAGGRFHVAGTPAVSTTWPAVAAAAAQRDDADLSAEGDFAATTPTFPFGTHVAVVEVDTDTGRVDLRRLVAVDDAGRIINPLLAEGQRHGGIAQGVGQALFEQVAYDADGNPITSNFADYAIVSAAELPSFDLVTMETPTPVNPLGAKGIGESGTIGSAPAVQNAVCDALAHLGVRHIDMPCTPERVWQALREAGSITGAHP